MHDFVHVMPDKRSLSVERKRGFVMSWMTPDLGADEPAPRPGTSLKGVGGGCERVCV